MYVHVLHVHVLTVSVNIARLNLAVETIHEDIHISAFI